MKKITKWIAVGLFLGIVISLIGQDRAFALQITDPKACPDVEFIWARASGDSLDDYSYIEWQRALNSELRKSRLTWSHYELGQDSTSEYVYPAVSILPNGGDSFSQALDHFGNGLGAVVSGGRAFDYGNSVHLGVMELIGYFGQRRADCGKTRFVFGGYSQGAQVIGDTVQILPENMQKDVIYSALFGDPKLNLPEGRGLFPDACEQKNISPWNIWAPNCHTDDGFLGTREPYAPIGYEDRTGLWCNSYDIICGSTNLFWQFDGHKAYVSEGRIEHSAQIIRQRIEEAFPDKMSPLIPVKPETDKLKILLVDLWSNRRTPGNLFEHFHDFSVTGCRLYLYLSDQGAQIGKVAANGMQHIFAITDPLSGPNVWPGPKCNQVSLDSSQGYGEAFALIPRHYFMQEALPIMSQNAQQISSKNGGFLLIVAAKATKLEAIDMDDVERNWSCVDDTSQVYIEGIAISVANPTNQPDFISTVQETLGGSVFEVDTSTPPYTSKVSELVMQTNEARSHPTAAAFSTQAATNANNLPLDTEESWRPSAATQPIWVNTEAISSSAVKLSWDNTATGAERFVIRVNGVALGFVDSSRDSIILTDIDTAKPVSFSVVGVDSAGRVGEQTKTEAYPQDFDKFERGNTAQSAITPTAPLEAPQTIPSALNPFPPTLFTTYTPGFAAPFPGTSLETTSTAPFKSDPLYPPESGPEEPTEPANGAIGWQKILISGIILLLAVGGTVIGFKLFKH